MSIRMKVTAAVLAATLATALGSTSSEAKGWGRGPSLGIGIVADALLGAAAASAYGPYYSYDPVFQRCHRVPKYDAYGNDVGSVRLCNAAPD